jgi:O-antigen/teichoic acid export membrane protein
MSRTVSHLFRNLLVYGAGDAATSIIGFLLLPVYVRYLSPSDYGVIALLLTVEVGIKIVFRWGVDASFMRLYYDCRDDRDRQRLASTLFFPLLAVNGLLLAAALAAAPWLSLRLFDTQGYATPLRLVFCTTFLGGFYFLPFHILRIAGRSTTFIALTVSAQAATLGLKLLLVVGVGMGVLGVVLADFVVALGFTVRLIPFYAPLIRPMFSGALLREALRFGLPRLPHGIAHQVIAVSDRYLLSAFVSLRDVGIYSIGASFALGLKLFLSAFENAWAPFYFATMREPNAKETLSRVTTYAWAALVLLAAGLTAVADDVVRLMTTADFYGASAVIPWVAAGVVFQGVYLLTSIGLNITKQTKYYPISTSIAAFTSVAANLLLIPRFGAIGAAWANTLSYAVLAATAMRFSQRAYPLRYEWRRISLIVVAGVVACAAAHVIVPRPLPPAAGFLVRGGVVALGYPLLLVALGFFRRGEREQLRTLVVRLLDRAGRRAAPGGQADQVAQASGVSMEGALDAGLAGGSPLSTRDPA